jgi:hypothetical protein
MCLQGVEPGSPNSQSNGLPIELAGQLSVLHSVLFFEKIKHV